MTILNKQQCLELISQDTGAWAFKSYLKNNKVTIDDINIAKEALQKDGTLLSFCSEAFKSNYELATIAVTNNGMALDYASQELKNNDDIVKIAMKMNQAIVFASSRIKHNKDFALVSLRQNANDIRFYSKEIQDICGEGGSPQARRMQVQNLEKAINSEKLANQLEKELSPKQKVVKVKI